MKKWWWVVGLGLVVFVSFYGLGRVPAAFYWDEAALGYEAWSLLKTGADEFGNKWPLYFKSIGDFKYPLYSYLSMIPVAVMGLNMFSARAVAALSGTIIMAVVFQMAMEQGWFKRKDWPWLGLALVASLASPWYLLFARTAREATVAVALLVVGFWAWRRNKLWLMVVTWSLAGLTYSASRLLVPLLLIGMMIVSRKEKPFIFSFAFIRVSPFLMSAAVIVMVMMGLSLDPRSRLRAGGTVNLIDKETIVTAQGQVFEVGMAMSGKAGIILARIYSNKVAIKLLEWLDAYGRHFDFSYLFTKANPDLPWYQVPGMGLLLVVMAPVMLLGVMDILRQWKTDQFGLLVLWWWLVAAIPPALTTEVPNPIRQLAGLPAVIWIWIRGVKVVAEAKLPKAVVAMIAAAVLLNAGYGFKQFFIHREYHRPWYSNQGIAQVVEYIGEHQNEYEYIVMPEEPYIFFLFFGGEKYNWGAQDLKLLERQWGSVAGLKNLVFLMPHNCPQIGKEGVLYMCLGNKIPENSRLKFLARFKDGEPAYSLIEFVKQLKVGEPPQLPDRLGYLPRIERLDSDGVIKPFEDKLWE